MSAFDHLTTNGWKEVPTDKNREAICKTTSSCYEFTNSKNTVLSLLTSNEKDNYLIRLQHSRGGNVQFFQVTSSNAESVAISINQLKEEADANNYFGLYFSLQSNFDSASIIAWEQWESNYR